MFIKFPVTALETALATTSFQDFTDRAIPQVVGAINSTHIEILDPLSDVREQTRLLSKKKIEYHKFTGCCWLKLDVFRCFDQLPMECARCKNIT